MCFDSAFLALFFSFFFFLSDGSPAGEAVDHRQVQRELGDVSVYLQKPVILSPTSASLSWTVSVRQPRSIFKRARVHHTRWKKKAEADPPFPGGPSVSVHSGLPRVLPHRRQLLAGPGRGSPLGPQRRPDRPAERRRIRGEDTALL